MGRPHRARVTGLAALIAVSALVTGACTGPGYDPEAVPPSPPGRTPPAPTPPAPTAPVAQSGGAVPATPAAPPGPTGAGCPASGVAISAGRVEAALGHRASVLVLVNCGTRPYQVNGYPPVSVLDADRKPLDVTVRNGSSYMGRDPGPRRVTLAPGESVRSILAWSGTVTFGDPASGAYLVVAPAPGAVPQTLPLETDLGTTAELDVTAWAVNLLN